MTPLNLKLPSCELLLAIGTLVLPLSPYLCIGLYTLAGIKSALSYKDKILTKEQKIIGLGFIVLSVWMLLRIGNAWGWGIHSLKIPGMYPSTIVDYVPFFIFFYTVALYSWNIAKIEKIAWSFTATAFPQFGLAFAQKYLDLQGQVLFYPHPYLALVKINLSAPTTINAGFDNTNILGCYTIVILPVTFGLLFKEIQRAKTYLSEQQNSTLFFIVTIRVLIVLLAIVSLILTLFWSGSRSSLLTLAFIVIAFIIYKRSIFLAFSGLIVSTIVGIASLELGRFTQLFRYLVPSEVWNRLSVEGFNSSERIKIYRCVIELIKDKPLVGWGLGNPAPECEHRLNSAATSVNHAHNIFLQLVADIGLPFTFVLSCLIAYILFSSIKHLLKLKYQGDRDLKFGFFVAVLSVILMSSFTAGTLASYRLSFLFWLCLAISYSGIPETHERPYPSMYQENSVEKSY